MPQALDAIIAQLEESKSNPAIFRPDENYRVQAFGGLLQAMRTSVATLLDHRDTIREELGLPRLTPKTPQTPRDAAAKLAPALG